ncbi:MAG TPA: hypothetical protein VFC56_19970 [Stellaceae bacterium]|nr:hypothetical protein [Stellaceae bacterium]
MLNQSSFQRVSAKRRCLHALEPNLSELLSDPMMMALMAADRVDRGELDLLIADARARRDQHAG